ncbi:hypothetical protein V5799_027637 [Amblyomma americanum]|uniref:Uncharacterized protein n=1 Tax=Amblyomma americanum TaxID=6943 RepID=A0AAQ4DF52_AMBAM
MTDETSESAETQNTENHVRIKTPDGHSPGTGECVKVQCTTTGNECSPKDGAVTGCPTSAAQTDAVDADTFKADAAEASGGEIQENGEVDSCAGNDMEDKPFDKEEGAVANCWSGRTTGAALSGGSLRSPCILVVFEPKTCHHA